MQHKQWARPSFLGTLRNIRNEQAQLRTPRSQKGRRCGALARSATYAQSRKWRRLERVEFSGQTRWEILVSDFRAAAGVFPVRTAGPNARWWCDLRPSRAPPSAPPDPADSGKTCNTN